MNRIVVSLYDNADSALDAFRELTVQGYDSNTITLAGHEAEFSRGHAGLRELTLPAIGRIYGRGPFIDWSSNELPNHSHLIDYLRDQGVPEQDANVFAEGLRRGGILLSVSPSGDRLENARSIMDSHDPVIIEDVMQQWISNGWQGFDRGADPLDSNELDWPRSIAGRGQEKVVSDTEILESNWPENIVDPARISEQQIEEPSWPQNITARDEEDMEAEEAATNWPEDIVAREDE